MFQNDISISVKFQRKKWSQVNMLHVRPFLCDIHIDVNNHSACIPLDFKVEDTIRIQIHMSNDDIECLEVTETWTSILEITSPSSWKPHTSISH